ncbi:MAG: PEP-CTERM sorting domain-containing protein [Phycisphaerales bacterium]|nr:PEP-CTERM sorting domain-containing protein [Phycisphaerales bacterium]
MKKALALTLVTLFAAGSYAAIVIQDNFDSYADQAAFLAAWPTDPTIAVPTPLALSTDQAHSAPQSVFQEGNVARRNYRLFGQEVAPSDLQPLMAEFWLYVPATNSNSRLYCEIRGYSGTGLGDGSLQELIAIGTTNVLTGGAAWFQGRVAFAGLANSGWINLNLPGAPARTAGWHKLGIEVKDAGVVNFYVNDILSGTITDPTPIASYDTFMLGSGLTSNPTAPQSGYYDDVLVQSIPEPASLALLVLGGLALVRRR